MSVKRLSVLFCLFALAAAARAAVPPVISYQGRLLQPSGAAIADGTVSITFSIYDAPTGGTALWTETNPSVFVKGGLFSVMLGSVTPMPPDIFNGADRYFGIKVGADAETSPRQKIASAAYAQSAGTAETAKVADNGTPVGGIIMWSGSKDAIPAGWALCDGTNGTPNLQDKFILGAGAAYSVDSQGGRASVDLTHKHIVDAHTHSIAKDLDYGALSAIGHEHSLPGGGYTGSEHGNGITGGFNGSGFLVMVGGDPGRSWAALGHAHGGATGSASPGTNNALGVTNILPPYYALCFIMKVAG